MIFIGIDPGLDGAVAAIDDTAYPGETVRITNCPKTIKDMVAILRPYRFIRQMVRVCLEEVPKVIRRPATFTERKRGLKVVVVPATELRRNYGEWRGILAALEIPFECVPPKKWQSIVDGPKKTKIKGRVFDMAQRLYPQAVLHGPKGGKKDGRSDALVMAEYMRRSQGM